MQIILLGEDTDILLQGWGTFKQEKDDRNLVKEFQEKGTNIQTKSAKDFKNWVPKDEKKHLQLLEISHMPYEIDRKSDSPSLSAMTEKGIELLKKIKMDSL